MRERLGYAIEMAGIALVVAGIWHWSPAGAVVALGVACVVVAQGIGARE